MQSFEKINVIDFLCLEAHTHIQQHDMHLHQHDMNDYRDIFNNLICMVLKNISWLMTSTAQPGSRYEKPPRRNVTKSVALSRANWPRSLKNSEVCQSEMCVFELKIMVLR